MLRTTTSTTVTGSSVIRKSVNGTENEIQAASMSGTVDSNGRINVSSNIHDETVYRSNKDEILSDIKEFQDMVYKMADTETEAI